LARRPGHRVDLADRAGDLFVVLALGLVVDELGRLADGLVHLFGVLLGVGAGRAGGPGQHGELAQECHGGPPSSVAVILTTRTNHPEVPRVTSAKPWHPENHTPGTPGAA